MTKLGPCDHTVTIMFYCPWFLFCLQETKEIWASRAPQADQDSQGEEDLMGPQDLQETLAPRSVFSKELCQVKDTPGCTSDETHIQTVLQFYSFI